ncbi:MAG: universal stress protein [Chitinophagales bacterium]|nr:universal stress protein [Chitinophagaceae bacterium]MCB9063661.1 universal stress protein [Chitinophagales bacterium]
MPYLVTATDFSEIANNAIDYACNMANDQKISLTIVHSYTVPVAFHDNPMPVIPMEESKQIAEEQMSKLAEELSSKYPGLEINSELAYGDITDHLKDMTKEAKPLAVVIGNSVSENEGFWLGGNLLTVLKSLHCPVIAIPPGYQYKKPTSICFACDYHNIKSTLPAEEVIQLTNRTGASFHVLNIDHENKGFEANTPFESTELHSMLKCLNPSYHYVDNEDTDEGIQQFVSENNMDWLMVMPHKHNFFEGLFHKSHTKQIVKHAKVPLVAIHDKA